MSNQSLSSEEVLGIIPIDEEDPKTLPELFTEKKQEIDAKETRKSKDEYENQREREDSVDYGS